MHSSKFLLLRDIELFSSLTDQQLEQVTNQSSYTKYKKGEYLYNTGDEISHIYIVQKGSIKCGKETSDNNKTLLKEIVYKKELVGENIMTADKYRREFAQTLEDTEVFMLPVPFFKDLLIKNPELCQQLTLVLITKMSNLERRMSKRQNIIHFSARKPHKILIRDVMNLS